MNGWRWLLLGSVLALAGCEYDEVEREIGYAGEARRNPWLAAERLVACYGGEVESLTGWRPPADADAVWLVPAAVLRNATFVQRVDRWARDGGHVVVLLEKAGVETNDWRKFGPEPEIEPALAEMLDQAGMALNHSARSPAAAATGNTVAFAGANFAVAADAGLRVSADGGRPGLLASVRLGRGRLTALTDARIFRNRWIADQDHAALLLALVRAGDGMGAVVFVRGASMSFTGLLRQHLWAVLLGLAALLVLWLWRSWGRFGPLEAAVVPVPARGYDHHLEALGNFHWQLDRAAALLGPLREQLAERSQRRHVAEDRHQWLATRSGLPVARVATALGAALPADGMALTRVVADLQTLLKHTH